jgi:hypothetical protein
MMLCSPTVTSWVLPVNSGTSKRRILRSNTDLIVYRRQMSQGAMLAWRRYRSYDCLRASWYTLNFVQRVFFEYCGPKYLDAWKEIVRYRYPFYVGQVLDAGQFEGPKLLAVNKYYCVPLLVRMRTVDDSRFEFI